MKTGTIAVIGGYGQVGRVICKRLMMQHSNKVIAAGRSFKKSKSLLGGGRQQSSPSVDRCNE
ncbi:hypothetical protein DH09_16780 [Bacillaceae bacterium JMAK1]|nr:hypothetical protein DH09_16780 [Bacillaceae bacterium JMAK1]